MTGLEYVEGTVVSSNPRGVKLDGTDDYLNFSKFTADPIVPPARGTNVRLGLDASGFVREVQVLNGSTTVAALAPSGNRDREIRRMAAMKTAAQLVAAFAQCREDVKVEHVFPLADRVLEWLEREA